MVVDGGDDGTEDIVAEHGAYCAVLPVNMGQGVALRLGYELADTLGAQLRGHRGRRRPERPRRDPRPPRPGPGRRGRLRHRQSSPGRRRDVATTCAGPASSSSPPSSTPSPASTSPTPRTGYRALRIEVLRDVTLEQDQYQTAELIISAATRGWRLGERPTVWHPRASGESKKGHNVFFALQYARVILRTWLRERR